VTTVNGPLQRTQSALDISTSERSTFKKCRRQWEFSVLENLTPVIPPTFELEFGGGIHSSLEAYYTEIANLPFDATDEEYEAPLDNALTAWDEWYEQTCDRFESAQEYDSVVREQALDTLVELGELGEEMLKGYDRYSDTEDDFTIHAIEGKLTGAGDSWLKKHNDEREFHAEHSASAVIWHEPSRRLLVPIIDPKTKAPMPTKGMPMFSMRLDLLVNKTDPGKKGLWVYDHKTTASIPNDRGLDFDDQITSYLYGVWRWLGIIPRGFCFNYLAKHSPKPPRILKDGSLSTAKDQLTTAESYRAELVTRGLMLKDGTVTSEKHAEAYSAFLSHGWDRFFARHEVTRNRAELENFEVRLFEEWEDMVKCSNGEVALYPNLSRYHCPSCPVGPICLSMEEGGDWEDVWDRRFMQKPDRKASILDTEER
jgi:PD-(D/E)XK nuclease superfamily